jgi:hypothetical protein
MRRGRGKGGGMEMCCGSGVGNANRQILPRMEAGRVR